MTNFWKEVAVVNCLPYYLHKAFENSHKKLYDVIRVGGGRVMALKVVMICKTQSYTTYRVTSSSSIQTTCATRRQEFITNYNPIKLLDMDVDQSTGP